GVTSSVPLTLPCHASAVSGNAVEYVMPPTCTSPPLRATPVAASLPVPSRYRVAIVVRVGATRSCVTNAALDVVLGRSAPPGRYGDEVRPATNTPSTPTASP